MAKAEEVLTKRPAQINDLKIKKFLRIDDDAVVNGDGKIEFSQTDNTAGSRQVIAADLELGVNAGTSEVGDTDFKAPFMGNALGANLTKLYNYIGGILGWYSITGTNASVLPKGGIVGGIADGSTTADGAVVAHMDGSDPSTETHARAAYAVTVANDHASSSFEYGVDLQFVPPQSLDDNFSGTAQVAKYSKAALRLANNVVVITGAGAPSDGTTGDNYAGPGSLYVDITGANVYVQSSAITTPVWKLVTRAA